jgi:hypothetical protein
LAELHPDGRWATEIPTWSRYGGPGWRLVAAVAWGADPEDPRLHAASEVLLETAPGEGGLARPKNDQPDPLLTARALETMVSLGWEKHHRVQEWLAWFESTTEWKDDVRVATPLLSAAGRVGRKALAARAVDGITRSLEASRRANYTIFGHPNLQTSDLAEVFFVLASIGIGWRSEWRRLLKKLQTRQDSQGRWSRRAPVPLTLRVPEPEQPSRWITLKATLALLTYAVDAELPRLFPYPPGSKE